MKNVVLLERFVDYIEKNVYQSCPITNVKVTKVSNALSNWIRQVNNLNEIHTKLNIAILQT